MSALFAPRPSTAEHARLRGLKPDDHHNHNDLPAGILGYAERTSGQTGITTLADLTGLSVTVTVGTSRRIRVTVKGQVLQNSAAGVVRGHIREGATSLQDWLWHTLQAGERDLGQASITLTPSAGSHTYKASLETSGGNVDLVALADRPAFIQVEDLGPA